LRDLVFLFFQIGVREMNYDHVETLIGKAPISLDYRGHRYDIAFEIKGKRILIEVQVAHIKRVSGEENP
jgi:hypothetical protein